uniref:Beta-barrel assembly-enhancing protease n=1 Tax=uncultured Planctomycetota bacterium TaxID=120965 RepID=A0A5B8JUG2_9BACT|nr:beta-barrel assembly-enhancing protease [uncultured Planctomycetota bacterium]
MEYPLALARAYVCAGQLGQAERLLQQLLQRWQDSTAVRLALAKVQQRQGRWADVVQTLTPVEKDLAADALLQLAQAMAEAGQRDPEGVLRRGIERFPDHADLRLAWIDAALTRQRYADALERCRTAGDPLRCRPEFQLRAAQAYFHLGLVLGNAEVRSVPGGRAGQFLHDHLLVDRRPGYQRFLCCPRESALYQLRRALDGGLDHSAAHLLHARIWKRLGRPRMGLSILKSRAALLLEQPDDTVLATCCDLALAADALSDYLHFAQQRADRQPRRRNAILFEACLTAAEQYCHQGDEALYIQWLYRAVRICPDDRYVLLRLADAEWAAGRPQQAAPLYHRLLQLKVDHPQRLQILNRLGASQPSSPAP